MLLPVMSVDSPVAVKDERERDAFMSQEAKCLIIRLTVTRKGLLRQVQCAHSVSALSCIATSRLGSFE